MALDLSTFDAPCAPIFLEASVHVSSALEAELTSPFSCVSSGNPHLVFGDTVVTQCDITGDSAGSRREYEISRCEDFSTNHVVCDASSDLLARHPSEPRSPHRSSLLKLFARCEFDLATLTHSFSCVMSPDSCDFSIRAKCVEDLTAVMEEHLQEHVRALEEVAASRYEEKTDSYNVLADDPREVYLEFGRACDVDEECGSSDQNRQNDRRSSESLVVIDESSEVSDVPKSDLPACDDRTPVVDVLPQDHTEHVGSELKSEERKQALSMLSYLNKVATGRAKSLTELKCAICDPPKFFTAQTSLVCHYRSHAGIKPFICSTCGSSFTRQHSLNYHTMLHTNAVKFRCDFCGHVCRHRAHFKEHLRKHTGETPFVCPDCGLGFKTRNTFKRHLCHRHGKILTAEGGVVAMTEEEFRKVRTKPRRLKQEVKPEKKSKECSKDFAEAEFRSSDSDP